MSMFSPKHWIFLCTLLAVFALLACAGSDGNSDEDDDDVETPAATNANINAPTSIPSSTRRTAGLVCHPVTQVSSVVGQT